MDCYTCKRRTTHSIPVDVRIPGTWAFRRAQVPSCNRKKCLVVAYAAAENMGFPRLAA
jgi:hypothetical protein